MSVDRKVTVEVSELVREFRKKESPVVARGVGLEVYAERSSAYFAQTGLGRPQ